ncbi:MAG: DUF1801 domain-containing protein [Chloroflexota bacterium]
MFNMGTDKETKILKKIAKMDRPFDTIGKQLHETITKANPELEPTTWYGAPAYTKNGEVLCFFRVDGEFMTFGLTEKATFAPNKNAPHNLMGSAWFLTQFNEATKEQISAIVRQSTS